MGLGLLEGVDAELREWVFRGLNCFFLIKETSPLTGGGLMERWLLRSVGTHLSHSDRPYVADISKRGLGIIGFIRDSTSCVSAASS